MKFFFPLLINVSCDSFSHHNDVADTAGRFVSCSEVQQGTLDKVFWRQSHHVGLLKRRHSSGDPERSHRLKPKEVIKEGGSGSEGGGASGGTWIMIPLSLYSAWRPWENRSTNTCRDGKYLWGCKWRAKVQECRSAPWRRRTGCTWGMEWKQFQRTCSKSSLSLCGRRTNVYRCVENLGLLHLTM